jgi:hypothetical protein
MSIEVEVTAEMVEAGVYAWMHRTTRGPADTWEAIVEQIYRAMRPLEPPERRKVPRSASEAVRRINRSIIP